MATKKRKLAMSKSSSSEKKTKPSAALSALNDLELKMGITSDDKQSDPIVLPKKSIEEVEFEKSVDGFRLSTASAKYVSTILTMFGAYSANVDANFSVTENGIRVSSYTNDSTVLVVAELGQDLFEELDCNREITMCVNLSVFSKSLSIIQTSKPQKIIFDNANDKLRVIGISANGSVNKAIISPLASLCDICQMENDYSFCIQVCAETFAKKISAMPEHFTLTLDYDRKALVFLGDNVQSSIELEMRLEAKCVERAKELDVEYSSSFQKKCFTSVTKSVKLSENIVLALDQDLPLFVRYHLNTSSDFQFDQTSQVSIYIVPTQDENCDEDDN